jgi:hypothetical protein
MQLLSYVSPTPQCVYADAYLDAVSNMANFDVDYVYSM